MRLALKAQSNCRATAETVAFIRNPRTVFANQANISNGPQQVNDAILARNQVAGVEKPNSKPKELLEANDHRVVGGSQDAAGRWQSRGGIRGDNRQVLKAPKVSHIHRAMLGRVDIANNGGRFANG